MQTITPAFVDLMNGNVQPINWRLRISFSKDFNEDVEFFTLDQSMLNESILAPDDSVVVQPWDKYDYKKYDSRVISMEVTSEELDPYSSAKSFADVTLDNHDLLFSPSSGSEISDDVLPKRPVRMFMGFGNIALPQFVGLTEGMPTISRSDMTASFHATDFLSFLYGTEMGETIMLLDQTISEILDVLLQSLGLIPDQFELDESSTVVPFFYIQKGRLFGGVAEKLMEAELGRLYMNELGIIRFRNRYNYDDTPVAHFDTSNVIDWDGSNDSKIINSVKITANPRQVKEQQPIYQSQEIHTLSPSQTIVVWVALEDPVISAEDPVYSASELSDEGYYIASSSSVTLTSMDVFAESLKLTFNNGTGSEQTITDITIWGEPAKPIYPEPIEVIEQDDVSVGKYEEEWYEIDNDYIQSDTEAVSRALIILNDYSNLNGSIEMDVKANPALQTGDFISVDLPGYVGSYVISKIVNILHSSGHLQQRLTVKNRRLVSFFTLNESQLDGEDVLGI